MSTILSSWVHPVTLTPPSIQDNTADCDRLKAALAQDLGSVPRVDLSLLAQLPERLRSWNYSMRCVLYCDGQSWVLVDVLSPDGREPVLGLAVDLGTTRVVMRVVDLLDGSSLAERAFDNPQVEVGPDILARIHHAAEAEGRAQLRTLILNELNGQIQSLCSDSDIRPTDLYLLALAGNTAMTHLFLGLDPRWIIREPYTPASNCPELVAARDLELELHPRAQVYLFPNVGSYFGGDLIAGVVYAGLHQVEGASLLVDVGTNAEVVLGNRDWLMACAGAAGPALEAGVADMGMVAGDGVIDRVRIDPDTRDFELHTIDGGPPRGICGSGLIDLAAQLFLSGMIDLQGKWVPDACGSRLRKNAEGSLELVLVSAADAAEGRDLALDQRGLTSLKKAKAAMFTILETLCSSVGMELEQVERFYVAGTFGSVIDPRSAISIGMLPDLDLDRFQVLGNSSLGGAARLLSEPGCLDLIQATRQRITYLELNVNQDFMNRFSGAQFFPHTNPDRFPSVQVWDRK